jgi:hypothetical protein
MTLLHCFITVGEAENPTTYDEWNRPNYYLRFFYDLSYFLVIGSVITNVVFGIIIDSFA